MQLQPERISIELTYQDKETAERAGPPIAEMAIRLATLTGATAATVEGVVVELGYDQPERNISSEFERDLRDEFDLFSQGIQNKLNIPLSLLFEPVRSQRNSNEARISQQLATENISSVRDILTLGLEVVRDMCSLKAADIEVVREILASFVPEVPAVGDMRARDVARFCHSLDQVSIYAAASMRLVDWADGSIRIGDIASWNSFAARFPEQAAGIQKGNKDYWWIAVKRYVDEFNAAKEELAKGYQMPLW